jgi:hypothetical protein
LGRYLIPSPRGSRLQVRFIFISKDDTVESWIIFASMHDSLGAWFNTRPPDPSIAQHFAAVKTYQIVRREEKTTVKWCCGPEFARCYKEKQARSGVLLAVVSIRRGVWLVIHSDFQL